MNTSQGFSLTEVLVSLFIATSAALGLLNQQWQSFRVFNFNLVRSQGFIALDNDIEKTLAGIPLAPASFPFIRNQSVKNGVTILKYSWLMSLDTEQDEFELQQQLAVLK